MPSLAGLFGRKKQAATKQQRAETESAVSSSPTDYVSVGSSVRHEAGVYPSPAPASKLRLPFGRKKQRQQQAAAAAASTASFGSVGQDSVFSTPPRPSYVRTPRSSTSDSDADARRLRPPPSKSAIFAAYADPHSALSTRSLPTESSPLASAPVAPKKPGFFHWSKSVPKNTSPTSPTDSFNLKSFRHVGPLPNTTPSPQNTPPLPRPRGTSTDSSQRISVAAFREAQARRSTGGSPVPSLRAPSPGPQPLYHAQARPAQQPRRPSSGLVSDGESTSAEDDEGEETIKGRGAGIARALIKTRGTKSEVGHGPREHAYAYARPMVQSSHVLAPEYQYPVNDRDRSHSSLGFNVGTVRARASVSTSAVTPSRDAKRASVLTGVNNSPTSKRHTRATSAHSIDLRTHQPPAAPSAPTPPTSDSEDDAPLATLVPPRRPGSALSSLSSSSNTHTHARPKPLIDINQLTRRGRPPVLAHPKDDDDAFTAGRTLLTAGSGASLASAPGAGVGENQREAKAPVKVSVSPPRRFVSPPASPKGGSIRLVESSAERAERDGIGERLNRALGVATTTTTTTTKPVVVRAMTEPLPSTAVAAETTTTSTATRVVKMRSSTSVAASVKSTSNTKPSVKPVVVVPQRLSTPVDDLATLLGAGVHLIRRTDDDDDESDEDDEDDDDDEEEEEEDESEDSEERGRGKARKGKGDKIKVKEMEMEMEKPIAPIPIKQRAPPPSFRVTSRPPLSRDTEEEKAEWNRNSAVLSAGTGGTTKPVGILNFPSAGKEAGRSERRSGERERERPPAVRQRSSTLIPGSVSASSLSPIPSTSTSASASNSSSSQGTGHAQGRYSLNGLGALNGHGHSHSHSASASHGMGVGVGMGSTSGSTIAMPSRPFAGGRRESPAGSSTGDSSSGRAPVTPRDGSEVGVGARCVQRRSVSFEDEGGGYVGVGKGKGARGARGGGVRGGGGEGDGEDDVEGEERRKERRRSEARAAIELGNVINGRGPIVDDDDDDDMPINQTMASAQARRLSAVNPMMGGFGPGMPGWNMNMNVPMPGMNVNVGGMGMGPGMLAAADAGYIAAHQQAMMYAKQAYQMAVAQQAMAAAGDEWERSSTFGGAASVYGGAASVYGGSTPSVVGTPPFMMGVGMNVMGGGMGNAWSTGSAIFPGSARSMYGGGGGGGGGISGSRSEYGGAAGGAGQWGSSKSSYGDYGASSNRQSKVMGGGRRDSAYLPPVPPMPTQYNGSGSAASVKGGLAPPRARTASQPATPSKGARRAPPPSSWRAGGF